MAAPSHPKIYHICHVDRLPDIIVRDGLLSDAAVASQISGGTSIGMDDIKYRRQHELSLASHPGLHVGECVPFYFCPRSVMLYLIHMANHVNLTYRGGQGPIVHLEADLRCVVAWANQKSRRWDFTLSNAGSRHFEDRADLDRLDEIEWQAVMAHDWRAHKEGKQAEFLLEQYCPWPLIERIGVQSSVIMHQVLETLHNLAHKPRVEVRKDWYY